MSDEFDEDEEPDYMVLEVNEKGELQEKKEPFATVEVKTEKDWNDLQYCLSLKKKVEKIKSHVRLLQEGDPENEDPKKILDYIDGVLTKEG